MKKKILLPTDFSDNSWSAIVYALKFFSEIPCSFLILNVYSLNFSNLSNITNGKHVKELKKTTINDSRQNLEELKMQLEMAAINPEFDFQIISVPGRLVKSIETVVLDNGIDIVVMATKGVTGAKKRFVGSNTVRVINKMTLCPILVIPEEFDFIIPAQIAFPTDFNRFYNHIELKPLLDLAALHNSKIRIVHINIEEVLDDLQEYNMEALTSHLKNIEHSFHWMPDYTKKHKEINVFIEDLQIEMLAMVNYKHGFIENIIKEPVIKNIGFCPKVPFLVIPE